MKLPLPIICCAVGFTAFLSACDCPDQPQTIAAQTYAQTTAGEPETATRSAQRDFVSADEACRVAANFAASVAPHLNKNATPTPAEAVPITDSDGNTTLWAVNMADGNGYAVVSATRKTTPVGMLVTNGSFSPLTIDGTSLARINNLSAKSRAAFSWPRDSLTAHLHEWQLLEREQTSACGTVGNIDTQGNFHIEETITEWLSKGWEVYDIPYWLENEIHMPARLEGLRENLKKFNQPIPWAGDQEAWKIAFIVNRTVSNTISYPAKTLTTSWHTGAPYNASVPEGMPLSSQAVAWGQILNYFGDTAIRPFTRSGETDISQPCEAASFLYSVDCKLNTVFSPEGSQPPAQALKSAISSTYGYSFENSQYDVAKIKESLKEGSPVVVQSTSPDGTRRHASIISQCIDRENLSVWNLMVPVPDLYEASGLYFPAMEWGGANSNCSYLVADGNKILSPWEGLLYPWDPTWRLDEMNEALKKLMELISKFKKK